MAIAKPPVEAVSKPVVGDNRPRPPMRDLVTVPKGPTFMMSGDPQSIVRPLPFDVRRHTLAETVITRPFDGFVHAALAIIPDVDGSVPDNDRMSGPVPAYIRRVVPWASRRASAVFHAEHVCYM